MYTAKNWYCLAGSSIISYPQGGGRLGKPREDFDEKGRRGRKIPGVFLVMKSGREKQGKGEKKIAKSAEKNADFGLKGGVIKNYAGRTTTIVGLGDRGKTEGKETKLEAPE